MADTSTESGQPPSGQVGRQVGAGMRWSLLNNFALRIGTFASGLVLARLLAPADYGVFAIALTILMLAQAMNELGVSLALVRWPGDVRTFAPTVMTLAATSSLLLYAVLFALAPVVSSALGSADATTVVRVLCAGVVLDGITTVPAGILNRLFLQRRRFVCDVLTFAVGTGLTIGLAAAGAGAASFAIGRLTGNVVMLFAISIATPIRVLPGWDRGQAAALLRFGLPLAGSSLLMLAVSNVDNIVVGAVVGPVGLGLYLMAFNASSWPLTVFSDAARRVSLAGFSRLTEDPPALRRAFVRGLALLVAAVVPVCVGLAAFAEPLLRVVYGSQWAPAAAALSWLAALGLARVVLFVCYDLIVAVGRPRRLIALQALWLGTLIPALVIGSRQDGIRGAAIAHVAVAVGVVTPAFALTLTRLGISLGAVLRGCARPVAGGLLALAASWGVHRLVPGDLPRLAIGAAVVLAVYLPVVAPMRSLLPSARGGRHRLPADDLADGAMVPAGPLILAAGLPGTGPAAGRHRVGRAAAPEAPLAAASAPAPAHGLDGPTVRLPRGAVARAGRRTA